MHESVLLRHAPQEQNCLGNDEFGDASRVGVRRIEDGHTGGEGGFGIDLIGSNAETSDDHQFVSRFDDPRRDLGS